MGDILDPATHSQVQDVLIEVLRQAQKNGVEFGDTSWEIRYDDPEMQDWELNVVPLKNDLS